MLDTRRLVDGVILLANTHGRYLGASEDEPLLTELNRRRAVVSMLLGRRVDSAALLLAFAKPGHVLFGSDWPYAPPAAVGYFTGQLDAYGSVDADGHAAIDRRSAEALFHGMPPGRDAAGSPGSAGDPSRRSRRAR